MSQPTLRTVLAKANRQRRRRPPEPEPVRQARRAVARANYRFFVQTYFAAYATHELAPQHLAAAHAARADPQHHAIWMWFRGAAKSTHANLLLPLWLRVQDPPDIHTMLLVGKRQADAERLLADLRTALATNQALRQDFDLRLRPGPQSAGRIRTRCGFAAFALGSGQSPRGLRNGPHRPDYLVADDLDHPALTRNPTLVRQRVDWLLQDVLGTMDAGRGRFLLVGNRFAPTSILGTLADSGTFAVHRWDALGPDNRPTWPAKYGDSPTDSWLLRRQQRIGYRAFQREYQNEPVVEGAVFRADWIRWTPARPYADYADLVCYIDPSFRHSPRADFKAARLWGRLPPPPDRPHDAPQHHLLASFVRQTSLDELVRWCFALYQTLQTPDAQGRVAAVQFWLEGNLLQDVLLEAFHAEGTARGIALPLRPDRRAKPPKAARIEALAGRYERGELVYAEHLRTDRDTQTGLAQLLGFGPGSRAHDDAPDADEGALFLLQRRQAAASSGGILLGPRRPR